MPITPMVTWARRTSKGARLLPGALLSKCHGRKPVGIYYKARFQIEFLFRDAKQFTGLSDCQARSQAKLDFHFNASLSAVSLAKLEARQQRGNTEQSFSMASLKRRTFNQHLIDRINEHLANGHSLEKSSPDYEMLCNYGIITEEAA